MPVDQKNLGMSPDLLADYVKQFGGVGPLMEGVQAARAKEPTAPPALAQLSLEDLAALDRYTTFAQMKENNSGGGVKGAVKSGVDYLGGMGNMAATELMKFSGSYIPGVGTIPDIQGGASKLYNKVQGTPDAPNFLGGEGTSQPNLANLVASHYGYMSEPPPPAAAVLPGTEEPKPEGVMDMLKRLLSGSK